MAVRGHQWQKPFLNTFEHNISSIYFSYNLQYNDCANPVGIIAETVNKHLCKNYIRNSDTNIKNTGAYSDCFDVAQRSSTNTHAWFFQTQPTVADIRPTIIYKTR